jgi:signal transduction histidine kinase/CheY-like chemotaxis protein
VAARSLHHEDTVGRPASETLKRILQSGSRGGRAETRTLENVPVYTVFRRSAVSDWTAAAGIPMESVNGPLVRSYFVLGGAIALSVLLGLVVATFVGRTIVNPMGELEQSAARVGRGEAPGMPRTSLAEVRRVAEALGRAHDERNASFLREREARLAAEQASKAKDEFLAMLGHELRNPLAAITNASLLLERQRQSLDANTSMAVGIIARQSRHLGRLTDDLLDAGRVILGKISLNRAALDLAVSVSTTLDSLRSTGRLGDHEFVVLLEPAWVFADATRIDQIIGNLITNAVKYTPAGGRINISTMREGGRASFVITDSGIGLDADLLPRAFDLFVQGERTLDRSQGGLGIGLTLVRRLTELHGGTVKAESPGPGQGATFTVTLPAIDRPGRGASATDETPAESRRHVALIEDNDDARQSLRMLLEVEGHTVHEAADGRAGVALLEGERRISIAFVDIGLPGMDGFETARVLRQKLGSSVRIVALSGYGAEQDVAQGLQAGFDAYVVKPADIQSLRAQIALA